jgi:DNA repair exonuclease SbcCD ATPase subunit
MRYKKDFLGALDELNRRFAALEAKVNRLELENDELSTQLVTERSTAVSKEETYNELSTIYKSIREENKRLTKKYDGLLKHHTETENTLFLAVGNNEKLRNEIKRLTDERDNLKCCGNCIYLDCCVDRSLQSEDRLLASRICKDWQSDSMTKEARNDE